MRDTRTYNLHIYFILNSTSFTLHAADAISHEPFIN